MSRRMAEARMWTLMTRLSCSLRGPVAMVGIPGGSRGAKLAETALLLRRPVALGGRQALVRKIGSRRAHPKVTAFKGCRCAL